MVTQFLTHHRWIGDTSGSPASGSALSLQSGSQMRAQSLSRHSSTQGTIPEDLQQEDTAFGTPRMAQRHRSASSSRTRPGHRLQSQPRSPLPPIQVQGASPSDLHSTAPSPNGTDRERGRRRFSFTNIFMRSASPRTSKFGLSRERTHEASHNRERSMDVEPSPSRAPQRRGRTIERQAEPAYLPLEIEEDGLKRHESKERGRGVISRLLKEKDGERVKSEEWKEFKPGVFLSNFFIRIFYKFVC
jgi:hypothetical protein